MQAYKCDICGTFHDLKFYYKVSIDEFALSSMIHANPLHICPSCMKILNIYPFKNKSKLDEIIRQQKDSESK